MTSLKKAMEKNVQYGRLVCPVCSCYIVKITKNPYRFDGCLRFLLLLYSLVWMKIPTTMPVRAVLEPWVGLVRNVCQKPARAFWGNSLTFCNLRKSVLVNFISPCESYTFPKTAECVITDESKLTKTCPDSFPVSSALEQHVNVLMTLREGNLGAFPVAISREQTDSGA